MLMLLPLFVYRSIHTFDFATPGRSAMYQALVVWQLGQNAFHLASRNGHMDVVRLLLDKTADVNLGDKVSYDN